MFGKSSRYYNLKTAQVQISATHAIATVKLRRLPSVEGIPAEVKETDRLDVIARNKYKDGAYFWHVADANTELEANNLMVTGNVIKIPEKP